MPIQAVADLFCLSLEIIHQIFYFVKKAKKEKNFSKKTLHYHRLLI